MLTQQQQWCPRCKRYVETEQKQNKLGRRGNLVQLVTTCQKCRTTLTSKTVSASTHEQTQTESAADQSTSEE
ncbi:hypothetical protein C6496_03890 [Candidatus Poribacteria bacterium]|nr:MAG: hypothetical protein C6496_03890 [Candidatus Poribacteria bacterium]